MVLVGARGREDDEDPGERRDEPEHGQQLRAGGAAARGAHVVPGAGEGDRERRAEERDRRRVRDGEVLGEADGSGHEIA